MVAKCEVDGYPHGDDYPLSDSRAGDLMWEAATELDRLHLALQEIRGIQPESLEIIRTNGFVFASNIAKPLEELTEIERWEKLAFSLYTDLCKAEWIARSALDSKQ